MLEAQIRHLEGELGRADVVNVMNNSTDQVRFGLVVEFENIDTEVVLKYQIVSEIEADLKEHRISVTAPIIQPLLGREVGDIVEVELASGLIEVEILKISRPS